MGSHESQKSSSGVLGLELWVTMSPVWVSGTEHRLLWKSSKHSQRLGHLWSPKMCFGSCYSVRPDESRMWNGLMLRLGQSSLFRLKLDFRTAHTSFPSGYDRISKVYLPKIVSVYKSVSWVVTKERAAAGTVPCGFSVWPLHLLELTASLGFKVQPVYSIPQRVKSSRASNVSNVLGLVFCFYRKFLIIILHVTMQYPFSQLGEVSEHVKWKKKTAPPLY